MTTRLLSQSRLLTGRPRVVLLSDGDSKTYEPFRAYCWATARARFTNLEFTGQFVNGGGIGGTGLGTAGSDLNSATRFAAMQADIAARVAAGQIVDVILTIGTNTVSGVAASGAMTSEVAMGYLRDYVNGFQAAGGRMLWLMSVDPRGTSSQVQLAAFNRAWKLLAETVPGVRFIDTTAYLLDPTDSQGIIGGTSAAAFSAADTIGLHLAGYGCMLKGYAIEKAFCQYYETSPVIIPAADDYYDTTNNPRGNVPSKVYNSGGSGSNYGMGRTLSLGGTDSTTGGTVTGTPPLGFIASGALAGLSVAWSAVTSCPLLEAELGTVTGFGGVKLAISGTPSANVSLVIRRQVTFADMGSSAPWEVGALFEANAFSGCVGINLQGPSNLGWFVGAYGAQGDNDQLPALTGLFNPMVVTRPTATLNPYTTLTLQFRSGVAVSGYLILEGMMAYPDIALPAAA